MPRKLNTTPGKFVCGLLKPNGEVCDYDCDREDNMKRHQRTQSKHPTPTVVPSAIGQQSAHQITSKAAILPSDKDVGGIASLSNDELHNTPDGHISPPGAQGPERTPRRQNTTSGYPYDLDYLAKKSRKNDQVRGVEWITSNGKTHHANMLAAHLSKWGRSPDHVSSNSPCLLIPQDWDGLDPRVIYSDFTPERCPRGDSGRLLYRLGDHSAPVSRSVAWFATWPRRGVDLDILLSCGPFEAMEGSHLCHQQNCIVPGHITWESENRNLSRQACHKNALSLRSQRVFVPESCSEHEPPCLLQHAALTNLEAYLVQLSVFCRIREVEYAPPSRPRWHTHTTFEVRLPLTFQPECAIFAGNFSPVEVPDVQRPSFVCRFCRKIKAYKTLINYWGHIFWKHSDQDPLEVNHVPHSLLLSEIRDTAITWKDYWVAIGRWKLLTEDDPTVAKIVQTEKDDFSWETVTQWGMRL